MYVKILFIVYDGKIQLQRQLLHTCHPFFRSTLFPFKLAFFFCHGTSFNSFNFQRIVNNNNHLSVLFRPLVSSAKDKNFQCTSVFYQLVLKNVIRVLQCNTVKPVYNDHLGDKVSAVVICRWSL